MPFGWEPRARDFPAATASSPALALGLVVIEAAMRSGSLISARLAAENRTDRLRRARIAARSAGRRRQQLLKDGAILATEANDVIAALRPLDDRMGWMPPAIDEPPSGQDSTSRAKGERERIVETLGPTPVDVDDIILHTGAPAGCRAARAARTRSGGTPRAPPGGLVSLLL